MLDGENWCSGLVLKSPLAFENEEINFWNPLQEFLFLSFSSEHVYLLIAGGALHLKKAVKSLCWKSID